MNNTNGNTRPETDKPISDEKEYVRLTFQFRPEVVAKLDRLAGHTDTRSKAAEYALSVADKILDAKEAGQFIVIVNSDGTVEGQIAGPNEIVLASIPIPTRNVTEPTAG